MKRYIDVKNNIVAFAPPQQIEMDCSVLLSQGIVFVGDDEDGLWSEADPFVGRNRDVPTSVIEKLFADAEKTYTDNFNKNKPTPQQQRIFELKGLLSSTDYKVLPDYDKPDENIKAQRQAWREEIRQLERE